MTSLLTKLPSSIQSAFKLSYKTKLSFLSVSLLCAFTTSGYGKATNPVSNEDDHARFQVLDEQLYTGSLLSPSGAVTEAGALMVEPYFQSTISRGAYQANGSVKNNKHRTDSANSFILVKYGITNRLTFQVTPNMAYYWNGHTTASSIHFTDLPVEFQYRWINQVNSSYRPSLTSYIGMNFPTGDYSRLGRSLDAAGSGSYSLRFGLQSQAAYNIYNHALRVRLWGVARKPISSTNIHGISSYGTDIGYDGNVKSGLFGNSGFSLEYGITKKWVAAFDFQYDWAKGTRMRGAYNNGAFSRYVTGASHDIQVAPAIEYNPNPAIGFIVGTSLTVNGHNTNDFVQPQFAVNLAF